MGRVGTEFHSLWKNKTQIVDANVFRVRNVKAEGVNANSCSPRLRVNENRYFPDRRFWTVRRAATYG
jgi:hypothetical protein